MRGPRVIAIVAVVAALVMTAAACTGERPSIAAPDGTAAPEKPAKLATLEPRAIDLVAVATAVVPLVAVYASPDAPEPVSTLANPVVTGGPLVFTVVQPADSWYEVLLPTGPAGGTGWVRAADVTVARHNYRIELRLSEFRADVYLQGQIVRRLKLAVGTEGAPPPGDRYFTTALQQAPQLDPSFGTFAFLLSGWGDGTAPFTGVPGQYALHGTTEVATIGRKTATGSVAASVADIEDLATFLPLGVPVTVVA